MVIQEWWGLVDHIKAVADRIAAAGFVALAPDLYRGEPTRSPDEAGKKLMALNIVQAGKDIAGAARYLLGLPAVSTQGIAVLGFCMGGQPALYAAQEFLDQIVAAVDFYGIHRNVRIEPERLKRPILGHFGRSDKSARPADVEALVERLRAGGTPVQAYFL